MTLKMALIRKIKRLIGIQSPSEHMWGFKPRGLKDEFKGGYQQARRENGPHPSRDSKQ
jgi:hypothetical protein